MKRILLAVFVTGTLIMLIIMVKTGSTLKNPSTPLGILDLEFSYNTTKALEVVSAWKAIALKDVIKTAKINTWLDFIFIFFYAGLFFLLCKKLKNTYQETTIFYKAGIWLGYSAIVAGALDIIENFCMLQTLNGNIQSTLTLITTICASIKFILVIVVLLYCLLALPLSLYSKIKS